MILLMRITPTTDTTDANFSFTAFSLNDLANNLGLPSVITGPDETGSYDLDTYIMDRVLRAAHVSISTSKEQRRREDQIRGQLMLF